MVDCLLGLYYIEIDDIGECIFYYWCNEVVVKFWLESDCVVVICEELVIFDYFYLSGISFVIFSLVSCDKLFMLLCECCVNGGKVIFDNNYCLCLWVSQVEM